MTGIYLSVGTALATFAEQNYAAGTFSEIVITAQTEGSFVGITARGGKCQISGLNFRSTFPRNAHIILNTIGVKML